MTFLCDSLLAFTHAFSISSAVIVLKSYDAAALEEGCDGGGAEEDFALDGGGAEEDFAADGGGAEEDFAFDGGGADGFEFDPFGFLGGGGGGGVALLE